MEPTNPLTERMANIDPVVIVAVVTLLTLVRVALAKIKHPWSRTISETCDTVNFVMILAFLLIRPFAAQAFYIPSESMTNTLLVQDRLIVDKFSYRLQEPRRQDVVVFEAPLEATNGVANVDYIKRLIGVPGDTIRVTAAQVIVNGKAIDPRALGSLDTHSYLREKLGLLPDTAVKLYPDHLEVDGIRSVSREQVAELIGRPGAEITIVPGQTIRNGQVLDEPYTREDPDYNFPDNGSGQPLKLGVGELFMMGDNRNHSLDSHAWGPLPRERVVGHAVVLFWPANRAGRIR